MPEAQGRLPGQHNQPVLVFAAVLIGFQPSAPHLLQRQVEDRFHRESSLRESGLMGHGHPGEPDAHFFQFSCHHS